MPSFGITDDDHLDPHRSEDVQLLFTMYRGRIRYEVPMLWTSFHVTFVLGGMTAFLLAVRLPDFVLHNSLFLIAHSHNVIIGGVVFGLMAGVVYWFPKAFGFRARSVLGQDSFWFWLTGSTSPSCRSTCSAHGGYAPRQPVRGSLAADLVFVIAAFGAFLIALGILSMLIQLVVSFVRRENCATRRRPLGTAPVEWSTASPPPDYNFALHPARPRSGLWWT